MTDGQASRTVRWCCAAPFVFTFNHTICLAQDCNPEEVQKIFASNGAEGDLFSGAWNHGSDGKAIAVDGEFAIIGATQYDSSGPGAVYVFQSQPDGTWSEVAILTASNGEAFDGFGVSVALDGDIAVIGAEADDDDGFDSGAAYVFERQTPEQWLQVDKLTASDAAMSHHFGVSVAVSGDRIVVGAPNNDAAYVFELDVSWQEVEKLTASNGMSSDDFGCSVSIDGDTIVVGASQDGPNAGTGYVFHRDVNGDWNETDKLIASDAAAEAWFGDSVAVRNGRIVIGAWGSVFTGAAYVFEQDKQGDWTETQQLTASDAQLNALFGNSVSIDGDVIVIGATGDGFNDVGLRIGAAYVFTLQPDGKWMEDAKLTASDPVEDGDRFGDSTAISGDVVIIGAIWDDELADQAGAAYAIKLNCPVDCPVDLTGDGTVGPADLAVILGNWGPVPPNDPIADLSGDGEVGPADLAIVLGNWGPCS